MEKRSQQITERPETGTGNLLELSVEAARVRATLGEISSAIEKVCGRYKAFIRSISGVYSTESAGDESYATGPGAVPGLCQARRPAAPDHDRQNGTGRPRPRCQSGVDGYADIGFDVDIGPLFQTPSEAARQAVENDVHVLGVSSLAGGHKTLVPKVIEELKKLGREDIMVIVGGVIPRTGL